LASQIPFFISSRDVSNPRLFIARCGTCVRLPLFRFSSPFSPFALSSRTAGPMRHHFPAGRVWALFLVRLSFLSPPPDALFCVRFSAAVPQVWTRFLFLWGPLQLVLDVFFAGRSPLWFLPLVCLIASPGAVSVRSRSQVDFLVV